MSSPTYGTDKTAGEQLAGDVSSAFSISPKHNAPIDYKPRPELVKPAAGQKEVLPPPQESIETANTEWPESPEARRARLRADATAHQDDPSYQSQIVDDVQTDPAAVKKAMADSGSSHPPRWSPEDSDKAAPPRSSAAWPKASRAIPTPAISERAAGGLSRRLRRRAAERTRRGRIQEGTPPQEGSAAKSKTGSGLVRLGTLVRVAGAIQEKCVVVSVRNCVKTRVKA